MDNENNLQQYAPMMKAYLSLQVASQTSINFLNSRKLAKEAYKDELFPSLELGSSHEFTDACDRGFIIEPSRFRNKELARSIGNETAVSN